MSKFVHRIRVPVFAEQLSAAVSAIENGQLVRGPHLEQLMEVIGRRLHRRYVVLTSSGFTALLAATKVVQPEQGGSIWACPASTCFAMVNAIRAAGQNPVFADMELESASFRPPRDCPEQVQASVAIVPDHFGLVAPVCRSATPGLFVIEDAAQSFLSLSAGSSRAQAVVLSFYPTKIINGIDGGAIATDDESLFQKLRRLISYADQFSFEEGVRYNFGMPNLHAAFALGTISQLEAMAGRLRHVHHRVSAALKQRGLMTITRDSDAVPSKLLVLADSPATRNHFVEAMVARGVESCRELIQVCPWQEGSRFPIMRKLVETTFSLPLHPDISEEETARLEHAVLSV
jgi:dTDP-4-amino-4,6-dideoxygalactose transaminase